MSATVLTPVRRVMLAPRVVLFVRVGLQPPPPRFFVPYLLDEVCRASEDLDSHLNRHAITTLSPRWCRFPRLLDNDRYLVVEHGVDVSQHTLLPDDWNLRLEREAAHEAVECDAVGSLRGISATAARLAADNTDARHPGNADGWRWMWHRIDPAGLAHHVTIVGDFGAPTA